MTFKRILQNLVQIDYDDENYEYDPPGRILSPDYRYLNMNQKVNAYQFLHTLYQGCTVHIALTMNKMAQKVRR